MFCYSQNHPYYFPSSWSYSYLTLKSSLGFYYWNTGVLLNYYPISDSQRLVATVMGSGKGRQPQPMTALGCLPAVLGKRFALSALAAEPAECENEVAWRYLYGEGWWCWQRVSLGVNLSLRRMEPRDERERFWMPSFESLVLAVAEIRLLLDFSVKRVRFIS